MKKSVQTASLMGLLGFALVGATSSPTLAAFPSGNCVTNSATARDCQLEMMPYSEAPEINTSNGIRLNSDVLYTLFRNYSSVGARFISNKSRNDIFLPQNTEEEYKAFLDAPTPNIKKEFAVIPRSYVARAQCSLPASPTKIDIDVPKQDSQLPDPVVVSLHTLVDDPEHPEQTKYTVGSTARGVGPIQFNFSRNDCTVDNQGNRACVTVNYIENQKLVFEATGSKPRRMSDLAVFSWADPDIEQGLYVKIGTAPYIVTDNCTTRYPPPLNGSCGGANGGSYSSAPSSGLCSTGNATGVSGSGPWSWTCRGLNGGRSASCSANKSAPIVTSSSSKSSTKKSSKTTTTTTTTKSTASSNPCSGLNAIGNDACRTGGNNGYGYQSGSGCPPGMASCTVPDKNWIGNRSPW